MSDLLFGGHAVWFGVPAVVGTLFFLFRLIMMLVVGAAHGDGLHMDGDAFDLDHGDSSGAFKVLSVQAVAAFLMGFGWGGLGAYRGWGLPALLSVPVGLALGGFMMWLLGKLLAWINRMQSSGTLSIATALDEEGSVYVTVPARRSGRGSVRVVVDDRMQYYPAVTDGAALPPGTRILVVEVNLDNTLTVEPVDVPALPEGET